MKTLVLCICVVVVSITSESSAQKPVGEAPSYIQNAADAIVKKPEALDEIKETLFKVAIEEFAKFDRADAIQTLLAGGLAPDTQLSNEQTLLEIACQSGALRTAKLLLDSGADINRVDSQGRTPLANSVANGFDDLALYLLKAGADPNGSDKATPPLGTASWYGKLAIAQTLIAEGADIQGKDSDGNTPLHKAVWQGQIPLVQLLISHGAKINAENNAGVSVVDLAEERWLSQNKNAAKRAWGEEQVIGAPDSNVGDDQKAWASKSEDGQEEWLVLYFEKSIVPERVLVYENLAPGAIRKVMTIDENGNEKLAWIGKDPAKPNEKGVHVANIKLDTEVKTNVIKIYIDSVNVKSWNEIDAVGIIDQQGNRQWTSWCEASSTYASGEVPGLKYRTIANLLRQKKARN